jgi:hypothetical protein
LRKNKKPRLVNTGDICINRRKEKRNMGHMYFVDPSNKKMMIEFVRDEKTNKFYLWDIERARLLTLNQLNELMDYINQYIDTVDVNEIKETNDRLELKDLEERYKSYFVMNSYYTSHCLSGSIAVNIMAM